MFQLFIMRLILYVLRKQLIQYNTIRTELGKYNKLRTSIAYIRCIISIENISSGYRMYFFRHQWM